MSKAFRIADGGDGAKLLLVCNASESGWRTGFGPICDAVADAVVRSFAGPEANPADRLRAAIRQTEKELLAFVRDPARPQSFPSATLATAWIANGLVFTGWVGADEVHLVREGRVVASTRGHCAAREGTASATLPRHRAFAPTRALSPGRVHASVEPGLTTPPWTLREGDRIVLCTGSVLAYVEETQLPELIEAKGPADAAKNVHETADRRAGRDLQDGMAVVVCDV